MDAAELYKAGNLSAAIEAATAAVRGKPADIQKRAFLCELLCIAGKFERADTQLETITNQQPKAVAGVALLRQLIRAAKSRQEFFDAGRVPEVLSEPTPAMRATLEAWAMIRSGDGGRAAELLQQAESQRPAVTGTIGGERFEGIRDFDDVFAGVFELLTSTGKYYWVPIEHVTRLMPRKPERPIDLLWLPAEMSVRNGPDGVVYLPTVYGSAAPVEDEALLLGRATDWDDSLADVVRGRGLRMFLIGDNDRSPFELGELDFDTPTAG